MKLLKAIGIGAAVASVGIPIVWAVRKYFEPVNENKTLTTPTTKKYAETKQERRSEAFKEYLETKVSESADPKDGYTRPEDECSKVGPKINKEDISSREHIKTEQDFKLGNVALKESDNKKNSEAAKDNESVSSLLHTSKLLEQLGEYPANVKSSMESEKTTYRLEKPAPECPLSGIEQPEELSVKLMLHSEQNISDPKMINKDQQDQENLVTTNLRKDQESLQEMKRNYSENPSNLCGISKGSGQAFHPNHERSKEKPISEKMRERTTQPQKPSQVMATVGLKRIVLYNFDPNAFRIWEKSLKGDLVAIFNRMFNGYRVAYRDIESAMRLPSKGKIPPILIKLVSPYLRKTILDSSRILMRHNIWAEPDYREPGYNTKVTNFVDRARRNQEFDRGRPSSFSRNARTDSGLFVENKIVKKGPPEWMKAEPDCLKYWSQRFSIFKKFNDGILLDREAWFSTTHEETAKQIAERCRCDLVIDAFCGAGGNTIQLAMVCKRVIAIDIDPLKIEMARNNAAVYGVEDRIKFIVGDFYKLCSSLQAEVIFMSPPWGGPEYLNQKIFDFRRMPVDMFLAVKLAMKITNNLALFLPRNSDRGQIRQITRGLPYEIQENWIGSKLKTITVYLGDLSIN
jgi:trimethylguanosine synthase